MANIHDIAERAGVSVTTVSRVLNNHPYVSEGKRIAVQTAIGELHYTPNKNAVDLIRGETRQIGVIIPYNNNQAFDQMLHGALNKAVENNYTIMVLPTKYNPQKELEYLSMLQTKILDGVIITSRSIPWETIIPFAAYGPIISCEHTQHPEIGCAYVDRAASYKHVFQLLKNKGHRQVAFTTARGYESKSTQQTIQAYREVFGQNTSRHMISACFSYEDGFHSAKQLLDMKPRPTAIYANGDEVAGGIFQYASTIGLKIPDDLAIIGQENQPIGLGMGISTVDHQLTRVGEEAFLLAMRKETSKLKQPYKMIHRRSFPS